MVNLIHIAATPAIIIGRVGAAHGESRPLVLAELVWDRRSRVTSQKQGNQGHFAQHVGYRSYNTSTYQYRPVQTSTYWYVLVHVLTYFVGAMTWYRGVHHQLSHMMKCHDIVQTNIS